MLVRQAKITSKGQVTIPVEVRKALKLQDGDTVTFEVDEAGRASFKAQHEEDPFASWAGALRQGKGKTIKQIILEEREERGW
jgi:antitoxin PrlF